MTTNPFRKHPLFLAQLPRIVRLYIFHCMVGFVISALFTGLILWFNIANIGHLVSAVSGGWIAAFVFFMLNGIVFSGVQTGLVIMSLGKDDTPGGGLRSPEPVFEPSTIAIPVDRRRR